MFKTLASAKFLGKGFKKNGVFLLSFAEELLIDSLMVVYGNKWQYQGADSVIRFYVLHPKI